jgi:type II secretory pathway pseudopilin PulG
MRASRYLLAIPAIALLVAVGTGLSACGSTSTGGFGARADASKAQANVRAAILAVEAYYEDHNSYEGISIEKLQKIDYGIGTQIEIDPIDSSLATKTSYCIQSTVGSSTYHVSAQHAIKQGPCE